MYNWVSGAPWVPEASSRKSCLPIRHDDVSVKEWVWDRKAFIRRWFSATLIFRFQSILNRTSVCLKAGNFSFLMLIKTYTPDEITRKARMKNRTWYLKTKSNPLSYEFSM